MLEAGTCQWQVARALTLTRSDARSTWNSYHTYENVLYLHGSGRYRSTTVLQDRIVVLSSWSFWQLLGISGRVPACDSKQWGNLLCTTWPALRIPLRWTTSEWVAQQGPVLVSDEPKLCLKFYRQATVNANTASGQYKFWHHLTPPKKNDPWS